MNQLARVAFGLCGVFLIVDGIASVGSSTLYSAGQIQEIASGDLFTTWSVRLVLALALAIPLYVLPGILLVRFRDSLANWLYSEGAQRVPIPTDGLFLVGCALLGVWFAFEGFAGIFVAGVSAVTESDSEFISQFSGWAVVPFAAQAAGGLGLLVWARRAWAVRNAD